MFLLEREMMNDSINNCPHQKSLIWQTFRLLLDCSAYPYKRVRYSKISLVDKIDCIVVKVLDFEI